MTDGSGQERTADIAPLVLAISLPLLNRIIVGMLRIPWRLAIFCSASVSSLPRRKFGSSDCAAASNWGAIILHGPHQGAQKSITVGIPLWAIIFSNAARDSALTEPVNSAFLHLPHLGELPRRLAGSLLLARQCGHTMWVTSLIV